MNFTTYSLHQQVDMPSNVLVIYNPTKRGWATGINYLDHTSLQLSTTGWFVSEKAHYIGSLIANFDSLEDLHLNYPELFI